MFERFNQLMDELFDSDREDCAAVEEITSNLEENYDDEEWQRVYDSVGDLGKMAMDELSGEYADNSIGSKTWREGTDFEE